MFSFRELILNFKRLESIPEEGRVALPSGCTLYWRLDKRVNARVYYSDEVSSGVHVWDTALVDENTLLAAIVEEAGLKRLELELKKRKALNES